MGVTTGSLPVIQNEREQRPSFFQSAPGHVTLVIAVTVVLLFFAWSFI
jgi:hypothetical protein